MDPDKRPNFQPLALVEPRPPGETLVTSAAQPALRLRQLLELLTREERRTGGALLVLGLLVSMLQVAGVGSAIPLFSFLLDVDGQPNKAALPLFPSPESGKNPRVLLVAAVALGAWALAGLAWVVYLYLVARWVGTVRTRLACQLLQGYLLETASSAAQGSVQEQKRLVLQETERLAAILRGLTLGAVAAGGVIAFAAFFLWFRGGVVAAAWALLILAYGGLYHLFKERLHSLGRRNLPVLRGWFGTVDQALEGGWEVKLCGAEQRFLEQAARYAAEHRRMETCQTFLAVLPRYVGEVTLAFLALGGLAAEVLMHGASARWVPMAGLVFLAAWRTLPPLANLLHALGQFHLFNPALAQLVREARQSQAIRAGTDPVAKVTGLRPGSGIVFIKELALEGVYFRYRADQPWILENLHLTLPKGSWSHLEGPSGAGKTTLALILAGLLEPALGEVLIDGQPLDASTRRQWWKKVAYVPAEPFFFDGSIRDNIAVGDRVPDSSRLELALTTAQLGDWIRHLPEGLDTRVGYRGVRLSGGQRQRLGIARALYRQPDLLILDEATSLLDGPTRHALLESVLAYPGELTVVVISHTSIALSEGARTVQRVALGELSAIQSEGRTGLSMLEPHMRRLRPPCP